jgi:hypothetical protein
MVPSAVASVVALALAGAAPAAAQPVGVPVSPPPAVPTGPPAVAGDFDALVAQAQQAAAEERHSDALRLWHAAYTQRQRPELLLHIARAEQRLGLTDAALDAYRRYLTAEPNPPPQLRAEAEQAIANLSRLGRPMMPPLLPPGGGGGAIPGVPPAFDEEGRPVALRVVSRRYNSGMRTAGIVLTSIGYGVSFLVGVSLGSALISSSSSKDRAFGRAAFTLLVPIAGPLISGIVMPLTYSNDSLGYWTMPWIFTAGAMQIVGIGLWAGAYRHPQKKLVPAYATDLRVLPAAGPGFAGLTSSFSF